MLITAFVLSLIFIIGGWIGLNTNSGFDGIAWIVMGLYPGLVGLGLAVLSLGIKWVPVLKVASPYLAWVSIGVTLSMMLYALGNLLLSVVWK